MKNYYLTTAIPYANAAPHIGTAMDYLYGDILLRYHLGRGAKAKLSIGTDEHGTKVAEKAVELGQTPQEFVDNLQPEFQKMRAALNLDLGENVTIDDIAKPLAEQDLARQNIINVRTTDLSHVRRVQEIWRRLDSAGVIYKSTYEGWYCVGCENFLTETEARAMDYLCPDHQKKLEKLSEENYYLKVSKFTDEIRKFAENNIVPKWRGKEILELIKDGAKDVSISRPREKLQWGVPVPGDENQVMYVWVDALSNYITALNFPDKDFAKEFWPAAVEIVGKDILRFHAIIWPAMLLALKLELPETLLVHGFINVAGSKMSKSLGNVVSPLEIIENYGADAFRYYFSRHVPVFDDGDFTWEKFEAAYNGELANALGNLVSRVANMIKKYSDGRIDHRSFEERKNIVNADPQFKDRFGFRWDDQHDLYMQNFQFDMAIDVVFNHHISEANVAIEEFKPWKVYKDAVEAGLRGDDIASVHDFLIKEARTLLFIADLLAPFLPETATKIHAIFAGNELPKEIPILFPKKYLHTEEPEKK